MVEEQDKIKDYQKDEIDDIRKIIYYSRYGSTAAGILAFAIMFVAILLATFPIWVKIALISLFFSAVSYALYRIELYVVKNNTIHNSRYS